MSLESENLPSGDAEPVSLGRSVAKIGKLSTIYVLGGVVSQILRVLVLPVFTHYLKPPQMGIVALAGQLLDPLAILVRMGLVEGFARDYFRVPPEQRRQLVRTIQLGQLLLMGGVCVIFSVAGVWLAGPLLPNLPLNGEQVYALWLMIVWACFAVSLSQHATLVTQLSEHAWRTVSIDFLSNFLQIAFGLVAVVYLGWLGFGRQGTIFCGAVAAGILSFWYVWDYGRGGFDRALFWPTALCGLAFVPHTLAAVTTPAINSWLLNKLDSPAALAVFGVASGIPSMISLPLVSAMRAAYPTVARLMYDAGGQARRTQSRLYTLLVVGVTGMVLGAWLFGPIALVLLTAPEYHGPEAIQVLLILTVAWLFQGYYQIVAQPIGYFGGGLWLSVATISSVAVGVILALALIPPLGMYGAAWTIVGAFAFRCVVAAVVSYRLYPLPWQVGKLLKALVSAALIAAIDYWLCRDLSLPLAAAAKTGLLAGAVGLLWLTGVVSSGELAYAWRTVHDKLKSLTRWENP